MPPVGCLWFEMPIFENPHGLMVLELASGFNSQPMLILITFWATVLSIYKTLLCTIMYRLALRVVIYSTYAMNHTISYVLLSVQKSLPYQEDHGSHTLACTMGFVNLT